jgi:tetratricopeptide (TPR) repeat protein
MSDSINLTVAAVAAFSTAAGLLALKLARVSEHERATGLGRALAELETIEAASEAEAAREERRSARRNLLGRLQVEASRPRHAWIERWQQLRADVACAGIFSLVALGTALLVAPESGVAIADRPGGAGFIHAAGAAPATSPGAPEVVRLEQYAARIGVKGAERAQPPMTPIDLGTDGGASALPDVATMIDRLAARLEQESGDAQGWRTLGWALASTGRVDEAVGAYARAVELAPEDVETGAAYAEAIVKASGDQVTERAGTVIDSVLARDGSNLRARYLKGLAQLQGGDQSGALGTWTDLRRDAPADADWVEELDARIASVHRARGTEPVAPSAEVESGGSGPRGE